MTMIDETVGEISVMGILGDIKITWKKGDVASETQAQKEFDDLIKKGYMAYLPGRGGKPGVQIRTFDPTASSIVMRQQMKGG